MPHPGLSPKIDVKKTASAIVAFGGGSATNLRKIGLTGRFIDIFSKVKLNSISEFASTINHLSAFLILQGMRPC